MIKFKTYKYRIYPNESQKYKINNNFKCCRELYNRLLCERINEYNRYKKYKRRCDRIGQIVNKKEFNKSVHLSSVTEIKKIYIYLKEADSLALCAEWNNLNKSFMNFFKHRCNFPKFKNRKDKLSYITSSVNNNIRLEKSGIKLPKMGEIKIKLHRDFPKKAILKRCIISSDKIGRYYISIVFCLDENEIKKTKLNNAIGLDFKVGDVYVGSDGSIPEYTKPYKNSNLKLKILENKLRRKTKFSKNWYRILRKIQKLHKTIAFKRKDFLHKLSNNLSKKHDLVVIETLSLKDIAFELRKGLNTYDTSYYRFTKMVKYKLEDIGKIIINIDKWFPSSKKCSNCGNIKEKLPLEERVYSCSLCNSIIDRDLNAAINIRNEGIRILGYSYFILS